MRRPDKFIMPLNSAFEDVKKPPYWFRIVGRDRRDEWTSLDAEIRMGMPEEEIAEAEELVKNFCELTVVD